MKSSAWSPAARRVAWCASALLVCACGARTELDLSGDSRVDAGARFDAAIAIDAEARDGSAVGDGSVIGPDGAVVGACAADRECSPETPCVADISAIGVDLAPTPLLCDSDARAASDERKCNEAFECDRSLCSVAGRCVRPCIDATDCEEGADCVEVLVRTGALALQPLAACADRVDAPEDVEVETTLYEGALTGRGFDDIALPASPRITTWVLSPRDAVPAYIDRLRTSDATRTILFDIDRVTPGAPAPLNPVAFAVSPWTILLPNGPRSVLSDVGYELRIVADGATDLRATRLTRDRRATIVDLDLFYVGARGLSSSGDRGPRRVVNALSVVEELLPIRIGEVRQHDVVGGTRARFAMIESTPDGELPELPDLFRVSASAGRASVSIFFVRYLGDALGVSGGIPGPPAMHGTGASGIALAADVIEDAGVGIDLGHAMAHELGHFLGLFHTTEAEGYVLDPLPDTEECPLAREVDGDGLLSPSECMGAGGDLLMFWAAMGERVTADQRHVVERSAVLH